MTMSPDAPQSESCQLETRHWIITDDKGSEEQVDGPGVVGEYPVMYPGASFSWVSSTNFATTYGNMKGHFRMRNLLTSNFFFYFNLQLIQFSTIVYGHACVLKSN